MTPESPVISFPMSEEEFKALVDRVASQEEAEIESNEDDELLLFGYLCASLGNIINSIYAHNPLFTEHDLENTKSTKDPSFKELPREIYQWLQSIGNSAAKDMIKVASPSKYPSIIEAFESGESDFCNTVESLDDLEKLSQMVHLDRVTSFEDLLKTEKAENLQHAIIQKLENGLPYDQELLLTLESYIDVMSNSIFLSLLSGLQVIFVWNNSGSLKSYEVKQVKSLFNHPYLIALYNLAVDIISVSCSKDYPFYSGEFTMTDTETEYARKYKVPSRRSIRKQLSINNQKTVESTSGKKKPGPKSKFWVRNTYPNITEALDPQAEATIRIQHIWPTIRVQLEGFGFPETCSGKNREKTIKALGAVFIYYSALAAGIADPKPGKTDQKDIYSTSYSDTVKGFLTAKTTALTYWEMMSWFEEAKELGFKRNFVMELYQTKWSKINSKCADILLINLAKISELLTLIKGLLEKEFSQQSTNEKYRS